MDYLDFGEDFMSDEEVEEALGCLTDYINGQQFAEDGASVSIINPPRVRDVVYTYKVMKYLTRGTKAKVTYELNEPYISMGSVSVTGKDLIFGNAEWFMAAVKLSSNFNVYPKTDGFVQMDFTFHGLTQKI